MHRQLYEILMPLTNNPSFRVSIEECGNRKSSTYNYKGPLMPYYFPFEGQGLLIVDAVLLLVLLVSEHIRLKKPFWTDAIFSLCWSVIIVAASIIQRIR